MLSGITTAGTNGIAEKKPPNEQRHRYRWFMSSFGIKDSLAADISILSQYPMKIK